MPKRARTRRRPAHETSQPGQPLGSTQVWLPTVSDTGKNITPQVAMAFSTVYACIQLLADSVAGLPWCVFKRTAAGRELAEAHPLYYTLDVEPNPEMDSFIFRQVMMVSVLMTGDGFAQICERPNGEVGLYFLRPDRMEVLRRDGELAYLYSGLDEARAFVGSEIFHIRAIGFDGLRGLSPLAAARNAIGSAIAMESSGASFFRNGSRPSGVLQTPGKLDQDAQNRLRASWEQLYAGASNAGKTAILEQGLQWKSITMPADDAQFLQSRQFERVEICSIYRCPPHMIGDQTGSSYSNNEQANTEFVQHPLRSWVKRWELEARRKLFKREDPHFSRMNFNDLVRGDMAARASYYEKMKNIGVLNANEIREAEDKNSIGAQGDVYTMPLNTAPVGPTVAKAEAEAKQAQTTIETPKRPLLPAAPKEPSDDDATAIDDEGIDSAYADWATETVERLLKVELTAASRKREAWKPNAPRLAESFLPIVRSAGMSEPERRANGVATALCEWMESTGLDAWLHRLPVRAAEALLRKAS